jgi:hypothetical protein
LKPSADVRATGFSKAMSRAPQSTPILTISDRMVGSVQKQKTSGFSSRARAAASVPVFGLPSAGAASLSRPSSMSQIPTTSKWGLAWKWVAWCLPRLPMPTTSTL